MVETVVAALPAVVRRFVEAHLPEWLAPRWAGNPEQAMALAARKVMVAVPGRTGARLSRLRIDAARRRRRSDPPHTFFQRRCGFSARKSQEAMNHSGVP